MVPDGCEGFESNLMIVDDEPYLVVEDADGKVIIEGSTVPIKP